MDSPEDKTSNSRALWIIVGVIIALVVLGASVYAVIIATMPKQKQSNQTQTTSQQAPVTNEQLTTGLSEFSKTVDQQQKDRESAQQALDDQVKRVKLSN